MKKGCMARTAGARQEHAAIQLNTRRIVGAR
jgi:hypothetical protein